MTTVAVIGLGYVGLPLAVEFGRVFDTIGFDLSAEKVARIAARVDTTGEVSAEQFAAATRLSVTADPAALRDADCIVVAPASADFLAKAAQGSADDLLTTLLLCAECPVVFAPAMNAAMWAKPAVQRNVAQVAADGAHIVPPGSGWLSCRQAGVGRMAEPTEIAAAIEAVLAGAVRPRGN